MYTSTRKLKDWNTLKPPCQSIITMKLLINDQF